MEHECQSGQQLKFPYEITTTSLWPDTVLWLTTAMAELTVPWEEFMEAAYERKKEKFLHLCDQLSDHSFVRNAALISS